MSVSPIDCDWRHEQPVGSVIIMVDLPAIGRLATAVVLILAISLLAAVFDSTVSIPSAQD